MNTQFEINWPSSIALIGCFAVYLAFKAHSGADFTEQDAVMLVSILVAFMSRQPLQSTGPKPPSVKEQVASLERVVTALHAEVKAKRPSQQSIPKPPALSPLSNPYEIPPPPGSSWPGER